MGLIEKPCYHTHQTAPCYSISLTTTGGTQLCFGIHCWDQFLAANTDHRVSQNTHPAYFLGPQQLLRGISSSEIHSESLALTAHIRSVWRVPVEMICYRLLAAWQMGDSSIICNKYPPLRAAQLSEDTDGLVLLLFYSCNSAFSVWHTQENTARNILPMKWTPMGFWRTQWVL